MRDLETYIGDVAAEMKAASCGGTYGMLELRAEPGSLVSLLSDPDNLYNINVTVCGTLAVNACMHV